MQMNNDNKSLQTGSIIVSDPPTELCQIARERRGDDVIVFCPFFDTSNADPHPADQSVGYSIYPLAQIDGESGPGAYPGSGKRAGLLVPDKPATNS